MVGHDVGLDVDHQLGYLLGGSAALVMALPRSRAGKLDDDVLTGPLAWGPACGSTRGATVSGIDTTPALLDIVRERVPSASLAIADLEDPLPFDAGEFDVVTAFNSVQYAADPVAALKNMSHVTKPGGLISVVVWGPPAQCESGVLFTELGPLMPPAPPAAPGAIAWSEDGQLEQLAATAGLTPLAVKDVPNPLIYPDLATAVRTRLSSGPARAAIQHSGLPAVRGALTRAFAGSRRPDGSYRQENVFRYLVARA